jgi:hypothetical protein
MTVLLRYLQVLHGLELWCKTSLPQPSALKALFSGSSFRAREFQGQALLTPDYFQSEFAIGLRGVLGGICSCR